MKKVISSFYCDKTNLNEGWLTKFDVVQNIESLNISVKAKVVCFDNVTRIFEYSISEFEITWLIDLTNLLV